LPLVAIPTLLDRPRTKFGGELLASDIAISASNLDRHVYKRLNPM
jgi:hypothetical protein